jgi:hypothetical protein
VARIQRPGILRGSTHLRSASDPLLALTLRNPHKARAGQLLTDWRSGKRSEFERNTFVSSAEIDPR